MPSKSKAQGNEETLLAQWAAALESAQKSADKAQADEVGHRQSLATALQDALSLGKSVQSNAGMAEQFVMQMGGKWDAYAKRNIFLPIVGKLFTKTGATQRSKYAAVLLYATHKIPEGVSLKEWVFGDEHTLEERYREATKLSQKEERERPSRVAHLNRKLQIRVANAKKILANRCLSTPIEISSMPALEDDYATVLVRKTANGQIELVEFIDTKLPEVAQVLKRWAMPNTAARAALEDKPLFRFLRGIELTYLLSNVPGAAHDRHIAIEVDRENPEICRIFSISTVNNFRSAMVELEKHDLPFAPGLLLTLSDDSIKSFIKSFTDGSSWEVADSGGAYLLSNEDGVSHVISALDVDQTRAWRTGVFEPVDEPSISYDADNAERFTQWIDAVKGQLVKKNEDSVEKESVRPVVKMSSDKAYVFASLVDVPGARCDLFQISEKLDIPQDRFLVVDDLKKLAKAVMLYGLSLTGGIVDADQPAASIRLQHAIGADTVMFSVPIAVSRKGEYAECCSDFVRKELDAEV